VLAGDALSEPPQGWEMPAGAVAAPNGAGSQYKNGCSAHAVADHEEGALQVQEGARVTLLL